MTKGSSLQRRKTCCVTSSYLNRGSCVSICMDQSGCQETETGHSRVALLFSLALWSIVRPQDRSTSKESIELEKGVQVRPLRPFRRPLVLAIVFITAHHTKAGQQCPVCPFPYSVCWSWTMYHMRCYGGGHDSQGSVPWWEPGSSAFRDTGARGARALKQRAKM